MNIEINDEIFEVIILRKNNKNTYLRVKDDLKIYITTSRFSSDKFINDLLDDNLENIEKMIEKIKAKNKYENEFYYLGKKYEIKLANNIDLNKWYKEKALIKFNERLKTIFERFEEDIPFPNLKIRKMKTRWGVCNRKNNNVTLNLELIKKDIEAIDYVIIHELCHFIHFDHSKNFWNLVSKYEPNYKKIRSKLTDYENL